jgi:hypothetical protein
LSGIDFVKAVQSRSRRQAATDATIAAFRRKVVANAPRDGQSPFQANKPAAQQRELHATDTVDRH